MAKFRPNYFIYSNFYPSRNNEVVRSVNSQIRELQIAISFAIFWIGGQMSPFLETSDTEHFIFQSFKVLWWSCKNSICPLGNPLVQKFIPVTGFSELGDWIVPKIGLYLHPISAEDPMEPFLEISIFSWFLGLFRWNFGRFLKKAQNLTRKVPEIGWKLKYPKKAP